MNIFFFQMSFDWRGAVLNNMIEIWNISWSFTTAIITNDI